MINCLVSISRAEWSGDKVRLSPSERKLTLARLEFRSGTELVFFESGEKCGNLTTTKVECM